MTIDILYLGGCPSYPVVVEMLEKLLREEGVLVPVQHSRVSSHDEAICQRFLGSPTIRIDGQDVEAAAQARQDFGMKCRLYCVAGRLVGVPEENLLRAAIRDAKQRELEALWSGVAGR